MTAALILNQAQAEAVYSAMCALNNVGGRLEEVRLDTADDALQVTERENGAVQVIRGFRTAEHYEGRVDFATAYGLNNDAEQAEPAAQSKCPGGAACGWDDKAKMGDICRVCGEQIPF